MSYADSKYLYGHPCNNGKGYCGTPTQCEVGFTYDDICERVCCDVIPDYTIGDKCKLPNSSDSEIDGKVLYKSECRHDWNQLTGADSTGEFKVCCSPEPEPADTIKECENVIVDGF